MMMVMTGEECDFNFVYLLLSLFAINLKTMQTCKVSLLLVKSLFNFFVFLCLLFYYTQKCFPQTSENINMEERNTQRVYVM